MLQSFDHNYKLAIDFSDILGNIGIGGEGHYLVDCCRVLT